MSISAIIPTCNRRESLYQCLDSIFKQTLLPDELIIVDSSDEYCKPSYKQLERVEIKYVHTKKRGLTRQRNIGVKVATGNIIVFFDDDVVLYPNYLEEMSKVFKMYPEGIGGVTGKVLDYNEEIKGVLRLCYYMFARLFLLVRPGDGRFQLSGLPTSYKERRKVVSGEILYGCNMAFRREVLMDIGFDEGLYRYMYMEDESIAYRVSRKYRNYFTPFAVVVHKSRERRNEWVRANALIRNFFYLHRTTFPRTIIHRAAFWWAICGWSVVEFMRSLIKGNMLRFKGFLAGIVEEIRKGG